jgi:hypothetical protein
MSTPVPAEGRRPDRDPRRRWVLGAALGGAALGVALAVREFGAVGIGVGVLIGLPFGALLGLLASPLLRRP